MWVIIENVAKFGNDRLSNLSESLRDLGGEKDRNTPLQNIRPLG